MFISNSVVWQKHSATRDLIQFLFNSLVGIPFRVSIPNAICLNVLKIHFIVITVITEADCVKPGRGLNAVLIMIVHQLNGFQ